MADDMETWAKAEANRIRKQHLLNVVIAATVGSKNDLLEAYDLTEKAIAQALLSAVMRERERCAETAELAITIIGNMEPCATEISLFSRNFAGVVAREIARDIRLPAPPRRPETPE